MEYVVWIPGKPEPQGSKKGFIVNNRVVLVESAKGLKPWREKIRSHWPPAALTVTERPIAMSMTFTFEKPKSNKKLNHTQKPDIDKLIRAVLDALTGYAYHDDSQVVKITADKKWGIYPGVVIGITDNIEPD